MLKVMGAVIFILFTGLELNAQTSVQRKCGTEVLREHLSSIFPNADAMLRETVAKNVALSQSYRPNLKTTANAGAVPVIFHIVLNETQIAKLGGVEGIARRVDSQMAVINRDFNRENADSVKIPAAFRPLYGDAGIRFSLAHRKPDGSATPGFEILSTSVSGYEESGGTGSGMGFTAAKFLNGGVTAWNPDVYLNVWVINPLDNGKASGILGLCIPPYFQNYGIPGMTKNELGVVLNWGAFGVRTVFTDYYVSGITGGRTLTHELGHYFGLMHIWGDDDGKCVGNGGKDDGISDTPPQGDASYGCLTYPHYDSCAKSGDGTMFMNFMDYVNDACMQMFTNGQAAVMNVMVAPGQQSYPLTQNPDVLLWPTAVSDVATTEAALNIYPNPASGRVYISGTALKEVRIYDVTGKMLLHPAVDPAASQNNIDISSLPGGMYLVHCTTGAGTVIKKLMVQ